MADLRSLFRYEEPVEPLDSWSDGEGGADGDHGDDEDDDGYGGGAPPPRRSLEEEGGSLFGL